LRTSLASAIQAPVLHVNGDDPEAVKCVDRYPLPEFNCDVFIDMVCYRRHGHNEGDPKFTQPHLYIDRKHPNPREVYKILIGEW
jgi:2-oxoglutarate dehydrogenase E1 component